MADYRLLHGDCLTVLPTLPAGSVHCCISSPPYFGLRAYLKADDQAGAAELGAERTPAEYVARLVNVFREVRRVLHPTGTVWLNLGDSYGGSGRVGRADNGRAVDGKAIGWAEHDIGTRSVNRPGGSKNLLGIPWRVAFALQEDGWVLRAGCPWVKRNAMCESVKDRPASAVEYVFLFAKGPAYFYDREVVRKPAAKAGLAPGGNRKVDASRRDAGRDMTIPVAAGRSRRNSDWWYESAGLVTDDDGGPLGFDVPTKPSSLKHHAMMPEALVRPCVLAGTSAKGACPACGAPWARVTERNGDVPETGRRFRLAAAQRERSVVQGGAFHSTLGAGAGGDVPLPARVTVGWQPSCACPDAAAPVPCTILDPFAGVSTVGVVAMKHGRRFVGVELNESYVKLGEARLRDVSGPLFNQPRIRESE